MEKREFNELIENICCATFHMNDEEAKQIIDNFLKDHPELLEEHTKEWYYKYC